MDGIHDVGGMQGFGHTKPLTAGPPFAEPWEGKAFALGLLAIRAAGANLHAFRHAIERVPPAEYLSGYYARWLMGAQNLLQDSGVVSGEEVTARAARLSGQHAAERCRRSGTDQGPRPVRPYAAAEICAAADRDGHRRPARAGLS